MMRATDLKIAVEVIGEEVGRVRADACGRELREAGIYSRLGPGKGRHRRVRVRIERG
jgi:hypothetical protein